MARKALSVPAVVQGCFWAYAAAHKSSVGRKRFMWTEIFIAGRLYLAAERKLCVVVGSKLRDAD